jgi:rRNA processing protein Gar1
MFFIYLRAMKNIGLIIAIVGLIGVVYFGIDLLTSDAEINVMGIEVNVQERDYTPLIVSTIVLIVGVFVMQRKS